MERRPLKVVKTLIVGTTLTAALHGPAWVSSADMPQTPEPSPVVQEQEPETVPIVTAIDFMKDTKDRGRNQLPPDQIEDRILKAVEIGVSHVSIVAPIDLTSDGIDMTGYIRQWVETAHNHGLLVIHRYMLNEAEGTYDVPENNSPEFQQESINIWVNWVKQNPDLFQPGDIASPFPEPQNLGVMGLNWCGENGDKCLFGSVDEFNAYIQQTVISTQEVLTEIGRGDDVPIICCGYDGFVTAGYNNRDHEGHTAISQETIAILNNVIAVDHYPPIDQETGIGHTYEDFQQLFEKTLPDAQLFYTEFGHEGKEGEQPLEEKFRDLNNAARRGLLRGAVFWLNSSEQLYNVEISQALKAGFASLPSEVLSHR